MDVLNVLLTEFPLPARVQQALACEYPTLAQNPHLDTEAWMHLYDSGRCGADVARRLVNRRVGVEQLSAASSEHRDTVLAAAVDNFTGSDGDLVEIIATRKKRLGPKASAAIAARLEDHPAAEFIVGTDRLWFEVFRRGADARHRAEAVAATKPVGSPQRWSASVRAVWSAGVTLDEDLCRLAASGVFGREALVAAAGSPWLRTTADQLLVCGQIGDNRWLALALAANPYLDPAVAAQVENIGRRLADGEVIRAARRSVDAETVRSCIETVDGAGLEIMVRRALPNRFRRGRVWLAVGLSGNQHLVDDQRRQLGAMLLDATPHRFVARRVAAACVKLGVDSTPADTAEHSILAVGGSAMTIDLASCGTQDWLTYATERAVARALLDSFGDDVGMWLRLFDLAPQFSGTWAGLVDLVRALS